MPGVLKLNLTGNSVSAVSYLWTTWVPFDKNILEGCMSAPNLYKVHRDK